MTDIPLPPGGANAPMTTGAPATSVQSSSFEPTSENLGKPYATKRQPLFTARDIFLGLFPNVVASALFWWMAANLTQQQDLENKRLTEQTSVVQSLLEIASKMMVTARVPPGQKKLSPDQVVNLRSLDDKFEVIYWGKWALIQEPTAEHCLTILRMKLSNLSDGIGNPNGPEINRLGLQLLIDATAQDIGRFYNAAGRSWSIKNSFGRSSESRCDHLEPLADPSRGSSPG